MIAPLPAGPDRIRVLLADDEPLARRRLVQLLAEAPGFVVQAECRNGAEAIAALRHPDAADVVFLDVQMPDLSGLQVLQQLRGLPLPLVVFVTAYDQYTLQAFEAHAVDYLLKPLDPDRFAACLAHLRALMSQRRAGQLQQRLQQLLDAWPPAASPPSPAPLPASTPLLVKQPGRWLLVPAEEVLYLEATGNYVTIYTAGAAVHRMRSTLSQLEQQLGPQGFLRIHRSVLVNPRHVQELRPWQHGEYLVTMRNGTHLTSSRSYAEPLQRFLQTLVS